MMNEKDRELYRQEFMQCAADAFMCCFRTAIGYEPDWFNAMLWRLFQKADTTNKRRLAMGFPVMADVYNSWMHGEDSFFRSVDLSDVLRGRPLLVYQARYCTQKDAS